MNHSRQMILRFFRDFHLSILHKVGIMILLEITSISLYYFFFFYKEFLNYFLSPLLVSSKYISHNGS